MPGLRVTPYGTVVSTNKIHGHQRPIISVLALKYMENAMTCCCYR